MAERQDVFVISNETMVIYLWVVYGISCQVINIFGIVTNIINIICFTKQGFGDSVNISLLGLAVSDMCSLIALLWSAICFTPAFMMADLAFDQMDCAYITSGMTHLSFTRISGCITAMITLERCLCITAPLKIKSIVTPKRTAVTTICVFVIFFFTSAPVYAVSKLGMKYFPLRNKTIIGLVSTDDRESVEMVSFAINNFAIPLSTFVIIFVCTTVLALQLQRQAKWRQETTNSSQLDNVTSRNQKTAKMVLIICTLYIVCFVPMSILNLAAAFLPELSVHGKYINLTLVILGLCYVMESINSSSNILIYYRMSSKFRNIFMKFFNIQKIIDSQ